MFGVVVNFCELRFFNKWTKMEAQKHLPLIHSQIHHADEYKENTWWFSELLGKLHFVIEGIDLSDSCGSLHA